MSRRAFALLVIVVAALAVRIAYIATTGHAATMGSKDGQIAHNIVADGRWFMRNVKSEEYVRAEEARHHGVVDPASVNYANRDPASQWTPAMGQPPGTTAVMAGIWAITGSERYVQIQVLQVLMDAFTVFLVYWIAMRLLKRTLPALIAAALYALYPPLVWQAVQPYDDIWAVDFTVVIVAVYLLLMESGYRWRWLVVCGLLAGVGAYFRPQVLLIAPVLAAVTISTTGWGEAFRRVFTTTLVASLVLLPWTIRNYDEFHAIIPVRSAFWQTMFRGLEELHHGFERRFDGAGIERQITREHPSPLGLETETPAWDAAFKPYFIHGVEQYPVFYLETLVHRVAVAAMLTHETTWMHRGAGGAILGYKGGLLALVVNRPFVVVEYALFPLVFLLAMLGLGLSWRRWREQNRILVARALCILVPYLAIAIEQRYLLPVDFIYFTWIGLGADVLIESVKARSGSYASLSRAARAAT